MKRTELLGIAVLLLPLGGCALSPMSSAAPPTEIAKAQPAPNAKQTAAAPSDLESAIRTAQAARKSGDLLGANKILSQLVLLSPDDARVVGEYGKTLAAQGRSDDAIAFLERATQLDPTDWTLFSAEGVAYDQKANYQAAQNYYGRALLLKPGEPSVLNNAALSHMQMGDLDGAEQLLRQVAPGSPDYSRITENLALVQSLRAAQASRPTTAAPAAPSPLASAEPAPQQMASLTPPSAVSQPVETTSLTPPQSVNPVESVTAPVQTPAVSESATPPVSQQASVAPAPVEPAVKKEAPAAEVAKTEPAPKAAVAHAPAAKPEGTAPKAPEKKVVQAPAPKAPASKSANGTGAGAKLITTAARTPSSNSAFYVQAGSFPSEERADKAASALDSMGAHVMAGTIDGHAVYRVRIGPFLNRRQANAAIEQAHALGHADLVIVTE